MAFTERSASRVLVVHESSAHRRAVARALSEMGLEAPQADSWVRAVQEARQAPPYSGVLISARCLRASGFPLRQALQDVQSASGTNHVVVLVDTSEDFEFCREVIDAGISGFVRLTPDGVDCVGLRRHVEQAICRHREDRRLNNDYHFRHTLDESGFIVRSPLMADLMARADRAAKISDVPILIYGESGTGKQLLAETVHRLDAKRGGKRFLSINCAAISGTLADSALFGHVKGAFTGATEDRQGHFRAADGGTLLLDEIGELDLALQPKLLRVLQEGLVLPVGADEEIPVDVRVIAATNRRLAAMVEEGKFRLDLFQRLNVIVLDIPPLRERPQDIPALVQFFVKKYAGYYHGTITTIDPGVYGELSRRTLSGNVRELENVVRQMLAFKTGGDRLEAADLLAIQPTTPTSASPAGHPLAGDFVEEGRRLIEAGRLSLADFIDDVERRLLTEAMKQSTGTHVDLARRLGLSRRTFYNKLRKHRL